MIPDLYPGLDLEGLSAGICPVPLTEIFEWPVLAVCPFFGFDDDSRAFGQGFARLLNRDLMVAHGISVLPPDEVPECRSVLDVKRLGAGRRGGRYQICGRLQGFGQATVMIFENGEPLTEFPIESDAPGLLSLAAASAVLAAIGLTPAQQTLSGWSEGRPATVGTLVEHGRLLALSSSDREIGVIGLLDRDPNYTLPLHDLDGSRHFRKLAAGCARDTSDAHLHFLVYAAIFGRPRTERLCQGYLRRALNYAPGHAKAHMCVPHLAPAGAGLIEHSAVAYRLLPGHGSAIGNLIGALEGQGAKPQDLIELAREAIDGQPDDPMGYYQIIRLLRAMGAPLDALDYAHALQALLGPPLPRRARFFLEQSPQTAAALSEGWDPAAQLEETIEHLKEIIDPPPCGCDAETHEHH